MIIKKNRIILRTLIVCVVAVGVALVLCVTSYAFNEKEENDTPSTANIIPVNEIVYASFRNDVYNEFDYYKFTIPKDGTVTLTMNHEYYDLVRSSRISYSFALDDTDKQLLSTSTLRWDAETQTTKRLGLKAGTYYLYFLDGIKGGYSYNFILNYTACDDYEKELNDTFKAATPVPLNSKFGGSRRWNDTDVYRFSLPSDGAVSFTFNQPYEISSQMDLRLFSYNGTSEEEFYFTQLKSGAETQTTVKTGLKQGDYYFKLSGGNSGDDVFEYDFTVNFEESDCWEKENNENLRAASSIQTNQPHFGALSRNEIDFFEFTLDKDEEITIDFSHDYLDNRSSSELILLTYDGTKETTIGIYNFLASSERSSTDSVLLEKGTYLIRLKTSAINDFEYALQVNTKVKAETTAASAAVKDVDYTTAGQGNEYEDVSETKFDQSSSKDVVTVVISVVIVAVVIATVTVIVVKKRKS